MAGGPFRWKVAENHLPQYADAIHDAAVDIVAKGVLDIQAQATVDSPVRSGRYKTGWQAVTPDDLSATVQGGVGTNVEYAPYVELGTGAAGASSPYPFPRTARYTMSWKGMRARANLAAAAETVLPGVKSALGQLQSRLPRL